MSNYDQNTGDAEWASLLVGRKVTNVGDDTLTLDNGTTLEIRPNYGCGGCTSGNYYLAALNGLDNIITNAELMEDDGANSEFYSDPRTWRLFVYAGAEKVNLFEVSGDDGNGYYGTGFVVHVKTAS